ncbi:MAG: methyltransferase domain-containing protein [Patescibacteria group bacterium]|nr:methyltransferase domain-containing protein [Patescibacteria group bacterium]
MNNKFFYIGNNSYHYDWLHHLNQYQKIVRSGDKVLEIGSSNLKKTKDLASRCCHLTGLEKFKKSIPKASKLKGLNIKINNGDWGDLTKIFKDNRFNLVFASHVIEHVKDDLSCLNQTYKILKDNGYFFFITPNRLRFSERIRGLFKGPRKFPYHDHLREYTEEDIRQLLLKSKFRNSKITINGFVLGINGGSFYLFLKNAPYFLRRWVNFWEVIVQKKA